MWRDRRGTIWGGGGGGANTEGRLTGLGIDKKAVKVSTWKSRPKVVGGPWG